MKKWMAMFLICSLVIFAGACSQQGTDQKRNKNETPAAVQGDRKPSGQAAEAPRADAEPPAVQDAMQNPQGMERGAKLGEKWTEPNALGPAGHVMDHVAQAVCEAGFAADPDGIFNALHPKVRAYIEAGHAPGMEDISLDALKQEMRQSMQEDQLLKCEPGTAVLVECDQHIREMYQALGLTLEACGKVSVKATLEQAGIQQEQMYTARVGGRWYLNDM